LLPAGLANQERGILITESSPLRYVLSDDGYVGRGRERERERESFLKRDESDDSERPSWRALVYYVWFIYKRRGL